MTSTSSALKIYFAGSIRGGRADAALYAELITYLQTKGEVLTEHIGIPDLTANGEAGLSDLDIYNRDMTWLLPSDVIVAEVTHPSLGVGFEIAKATSAGKRVLCLYRPQPDKRLSAMIAGCNDVTVASYQTLNEAKLIIDNYL
ncbi:MAG: nucleoside 2-deoxyribosyltransferase [Chitinophagales bacterium]